MSSKITIGLDNQTGPGMEQIRKDLARMGIEGDKTEAAMEQLNAELSSRAAKKQAEQIKSMADELDGTAAAAKRAKAAMDSNSMGWVNMASKVTLAKAAFGAISQGAKAAYEAISKLAETSPKFAELKGALDRVDKAAWGIVEAFAASDFGRTAIDLATAAANNFANSLKESETATLDMTTASAQGWAEMQKRMGLNNDATVAYIETLKEMKAEFIAVQEAENKRAAIAKSQGILESANAALKKATDQAESQRAIAAMKDRNEVLKALKAEETARKALSDAGDLDEQKATESNNKIMALKAQERKIQDDEVARLKAGDDAALKHHEETEKQILDAKQKAIDDETAMLEQAEKDRWTEAMKRIDLRQAAEAKAAEERVALAQQEAKAKAEAQTKMADNLKGNAGAIFAGLDPRKVAQQVGKQREKAAFDQFGREHNKEYLDAKNDGDTGAMRRLERQQKEAAAKARQQGFRDVKRGNASGDEMVQAQTGLANEVIGNAEATGRVNKAQADALREAANALSQQQQQLNRLEQDIRATGVQINGLQGRGNNSTNRAQRAGG